MDLRSLNRPIQGQESLIQWGDMVQLPSLPNRDINKVIVESIASQFESPSDIGKLPPLHVVKGPSRELEIDADEYGLINGGHRDKAIESFIERYANENNEDFDSIATTIQVPVIIRTDIATKEEVTVARFEDNRSHGNPPTSEERRKHALWLAHTYGYGKDKGITLGQIGKLTGLDKSTVSKLIKRTLNKEGETTREGTYSETLHASSSTLVRSIEKFFSEEKAFFSFSGTSEKDVKHRSKQLATIYQEKGYDPKHLEAIGKSILEAYSLIVQSDMSKSTNVKPEDVQKLLVQERDSYSITRNGVTYTLPPKK